MGFPNRVTSFPAVGNIGDRASMNPLSSVAAGPGEIVAGPGGAKVGCFHWLVNGQTTPAVVNGAVVVPPTQQPAGFLGNEQQGLNTIWLSESTLLVPPGRELGLFDGGDFWALNFFLDAVRGKKVFANIYTGEALISDAGSFPTNTPGSPAAVTASLTAGSTAMNITAIVSGGPVEPGQQVFGPGLAEGNSFIESQTSGTPGGIGVYKLTQAAALTETAQAYTTTVPDGVGGTTGGQASFATNIMTITTPPATGTLAVGQLVKSAGVAPGTYILDQIDATHYHLSTAPGTIAAQAFSTSAWVETTWQGKSDALVGDLVKIGSTTGLGALAPSNLE